MLNFNYVPDQIQPLSQVVPESSEMLLIGEWSEVGECESRKFIFTSDGRFQSAVKESGNWNVFFKATYAYTSSNTLAIISGNQGEQFTDTFVIQTLTSTKLTAEWEIVIGGPHELHNVSWQRC